jgi:hypothetical protein
MFKNDPHSSDFARCVRLLPLTQFSRRTLGITGHQLPLGQHQISQAKQRQQLRGVLGQAAIAGLLMLEQILHHMKWMLDLSADTRLGVLNGFEYLAQRRRWQSTTLARPHGHMPVHRAALIFFALGRAHIARIGKHVGLVTMEEGMCLGDIVCLRRRCHHRMDESRFGIHTNVRLHPEMPLVALLGLMHFRVTLTRVILGRGRCGNQGGIDDTTFAHEQALLRQVQVDGVKDGLGQMLRLEQTPKLQQCGGVWCGFPIQINPDKTPNGLAT